ncbi:MAG TPA: SurA N-terminal domain-containing protein [Sphingobacteriaceae bacterium]|nr:SurA N-terminal domain-containing protein [Sphingobacteriaceae bacterium]
MGIMSFLRNRAGFILIGAIGLAIVAFLVTDVVSSGGPLWQQSQNVVGEVAGEKISIDEFNIKVEQNTNNLKQQTGQSDLNAQMNSYVIENSWNQSVSEILMGKEFKRLGMEISKNELNDMITGKNPHPQVAQAFGNPQTGAIDRAQLNAFLASVDTQDPASPGRQQWGAFLISLRQDRLSQKYNNLIKNSVYVTSLEAREDYTQRNKLASFKYIALPYSSVNDAQVKLGDEDYNDYYNENQFRFKNLEETRSFEFVVFDAKPSTADSAEMKTRVDKLANEFRITKTDSLFVSINADTKTPVAYVKKGQLDPSLDSMVFNAPSGSFIGPLFTSGGYKMAKVLDVKMSPDSVKASHILINPTTEGGTDKAKIKADSIAGLIRNGASFAELATKYGTDASKDKGGDLGTFARGAMIPAFEDAVFNGRTGELKVVTTQFGVHVIKIVAQMGSSKVVKVAVVDKTLGSSSRTQQDAYAKATSFLSTVDNDKEFSAEVSKLKLNKLLAENITASQGTVSGLESPREVIRWAYQADEGDISDKVFEAGDKFIIARLTDIREKGVLPMEKIKKQIEPMVRNRVKAEMLIQKIQKANASNISQLAQKLGSSPVTAQNIVFANPILPGSSQENKVVGAVFGSQPGKLSKPVEGEQGVYVFVVDGFSNPAPLTNAFKQKEQIMQGLSQRAAGEAFRVLRDKAEVKDNRVKFF